MVRKKNLASGTAYRFRMRARDRIDWNPFLPPAVVKVGELIKTTHSPFPCLDPARLPYQSPHRSRLLTDARAEPAADAGPEAGGPW